MKLKDFCLWIFAATLCFYILIVAKHLLIPLVVAIFIWYLINAVATFFGHFSIGKLSLGKPFCFALAILAILGFLGILVNLLSRSAAEVVTGAPAYQKNLEFLVARVFEFLDMERPATLKQLLSSLDLTAFLSQFTKAVTGFFGKIGIILVYVVLLFIEQAVFDKKLAALIKDAQRKAKVLSVFQQIRTDTLTYIGIKTFTSLLTGLLSYGVMSLVGLDFAEFWAILIFLFNYIPAIGSILATIFPSILALVQFDSLGPFVVIAGGVTLLQFLIGNLLDPRLMGKSLNLSSLVIVLSLGLWGSIWGIAGMFLCVPITVIVMIIFSHFPQTRPIVVVLSSDGQIRPDG